MKLVIITPYFYPHIGGVENYSYQMSRILKKLYKWEIVIITTHDKNQKMKIETRNGMKVYRLPFWFKLSNSPVNPLWIRSIRQIIRSEHPDVVNAHSPVLFMADIAAYVCGEIPFILTYHSGSLKKGTFMKDVLIALYEKYFLPKIFTYSDRIIFTSVKPIIKNIKKYQTKMYSIPPGVDTTIFKPSNRKTRNTILYVGRIEKSSSWKGINYLLDAVELLSKVNPDIMLHLVGSGDAVLPFKVYAKSKGIEKNVRFLGSLQGKALREAYASATVVVLPSISEAESFGTILIEAMAMKKPVIGSNIGGIPYVIDNKKTGILVPPRNANALAKALLNVLTDTTLAKRIGENGYKKVLNSYTWPQQVNKFIQSVNALL